MDALASFVLPLRVRWLRPKSVEFGARVARGCAGRLEESAPLTRRIIRRDPIYAWCVTSADVEVAGAARGRARRVDVDGLEQTSGYRTATSARPARKKRVRGEHVRLVDARDRADEPAGRRAGRRSASAKASHDARVPARVTMLVSARPRRPRGCRRGVRRRAPRRSRARSRSRSVRQCRAAASGEPVVEADRAGSPRRGRGRSAAGR